MSFLLLFHLFSCPSILPFLLFNESFPIFLFRDNSYVLGSTKTLPITYKVRNDNEPAYLSQLKVQLKGAVIFAKVPPECKLENYRNLECDLNFGNPIQRGETVPMSVFIDTSTLDGQELVITAEVSSSGEEKNPSDNFLTQRLKLVESSVVEIVG